ncbi:hypothetical protein EI94DRAFT_632902 [Lactarius quietus]|nr:hypothetical protein EI94DRAFT_632902 [Lactarius quietus]
MLSFVCVDNILFRVHRVSDQLPLVLEDITTAEFERFLWVFYNPKYSLYDVSIEEWTSILKLAHEWNFSEVKELALRGLESIPIPAIQKIVLYQTYNVDRNRLQTAYTALTVRDEAITIDEGREVGLETALQLAYAREMARAPVFSGRKAGNPRSPVNLAGDELQVLVNKAFRLSSPGAGSENATQMPAGSGISTNASQTQSTQTNFRSSASPHSQGTGVLPNGSTYGPTNWPPNSYINGTANNTRGRAHMSS